MENIKVNQIYMDGGKLVDDRQNRYTVTDRPCPVFSWSVLSDLPNNTQRACQVCVYTNHQEL